MSAWLALSAVIVAAVGLVLTARLRGRLQLLGLVATFAVTAVTGWFAWYAGIQV